MATLTHLARWGAYLGRGYKAQSYADSQTLFSLGRAVIYPAGSWDIATFRTQAPFELGAFRPPLPAGATECYISDHTDIGIGINTASKHQDAARKFLTWMTTPEFATLFANALPGFFPLSRTRSPLKTRSPRSSSPGARPASRPSETPIRSCRAARPIWMRRSGMSAPR